MKLKNIVCFLNLLPGLLWADLGIDAYQMGKFKEAASLLNAKDTYTNRYLGEMFLYGYGVARDSQKSIQYFQNAAQQGDLYAQQMMARYALWIEKNPQTAFSWFKKAADQQDVDAMVYCAEAYRQGFGVARSLDLATHYTIEAAKRGHAGAQYDLAKHFLALGDKRMGDLWFQKSLKHGYIKALRDEAQRLHEQKEFASAQDILMPLLKKNEPIANLLQANWLLEKNDLSGAHIYLLQAAKKAYPQAQLALGQFYLQENTPFYHPDYGFSWILYAASQGYDAALTYLNQKTWTSSQMQQIEALKNKGQLKGTDKQFAQHLTNYQANTLLNTPYRLKGIWFDWQNKEALEQGRENAYPKFFQLSIQELFKPHLHFVKPEDLTMQAYVEAIMAFQKPLQTYHEPYPSYLKDLPVKPTPSLIQQAYLGVASAQFQLGSCYRLGRGVEKDIQKARFWYERAMSQDELRAEYELAMMNIQSGQTELMHQGRDYLRDAALKGDSYAAFTLGVMSENQNDVEAQNMLMIAAASSYPKAQYRLAEVLSRQSMSSMTHDEKQARHHLLSELYRNAFKHGIQEAALPLAFYQAESPLLKNRQWAMKTALSFATRGHPEAALLVGLILQKDKTENTHEHAARQWFQQAKNHPIGAFVWSFYVQDKDEKQALLEQGAQVSFSPAILNLAILKYQEQQSPIALLQKAKDLNDQKAKHLLVNLLVLQNQPDTLRQAREILSSMAQNDDSEAQWKWGYLLVNGLGGAVDVESGKVYLEKAAQQESIAQLVLGYLYHLGRLTAQPDEQMAKYWFAKASNHIPKASIALGYIYEMVDKNYPLAMLAYERVCTQESVLANYNMALMYEYGKGIAPNYFKATRYFIVAAESGSAAAMFKLSHLYQHRGYTMTANDYLQQAARHGYRPAMAALAWRDYL